MRSWLTKNIYGRFSSGGFLFREKNITSFSWLSYPPDLEKIFTDFDYRGANKFYKLPKHHDKNVLGHSLCWHSGIVKMLFPFFAETNDLALVFIVCFIFLKKGKHLSFCFWSFDYCFFIFEKKKRGEGCFSWPWRKIIHLLRSRNLRMYQLMCGLVWNTTSLWLRFCAPFSIVLFFFHQCIKKHKINSFFFNTWLYFFFEENQQIKKNAKSDCSRAFDILSL